MASLTNKIMSAALAAVGASALSFASAMPASAQQAAAPAAAPGGGWAKYCNKEEDVDICNVQVEMRAATGQPLLMVQLIEMKGKINRAALRVSTPVARLLPAGIQVQVDTNKPTKIEFATCFQEVCVADAPLTDAIIASFKKGTELTLTTHNYLRWSSPTSPARKRRPRTTSARTSSSWPISSRKPRRRPRQATDRGLVPSLRKAGFGPAFFIAPV